MFCRGWRKGVVSVVVGSVVVAVYILRVDGDGQIFFLVIVGFVIVFGSGSDCCGCCCCPGRCCRHDPSPGRHDPPPDCYRFFGPSRVSSNSDVVTGASSSAALRLSSCSLSRSVPPHHIVPESARGIPALLLRMRGLELPPGRSIARPTARLVGPAVLQEIEITIPWSPLLSWGRGAAVWRFRYCHEGGSGWPSLTGRKGKLLAGHSGQVLP